MNKYAEYKLINPSDPYTFLAEDFETATLAVFLLGTMYGAEPKEPGEEVPIFLFGGAVEWYKERFGRSPDEGLAEKGQSISYALGSFMLGGFEDRRRYNAALEAITEEDKRIEFVNAWQDGHSSLNDIGTYAHKLAERLKRKEATV